MPIRGEGLVGMTDGDEEQAEEEQTHKVVYVLHPNCAIEEM